MYLRSRPIPPVLYHPFPSWGTPRAPRCLGSKPRNLKEAWRDTEGSKARVGEGGCAGGVLHSPAGHGFRTSGLARTNMDPLQTRLPRLCRLRAHRHHHRTRPRPDRVDETAIRLAIAMPWSARRRSAIGWARSFRVFSRRFALDAFVCPRPSASIPLRLATSAVQ